jgi:hypothetical protein
LVEFDVPVEPVRAERELHRWSTTSRVEFDVLVEPVRAERELHLWSAISLDSSQPAAYRGRAVR